MVSKVDPNNKSSLTSFQRLQNELAKVIGNAKHGDRLPSEPALAKQLGVSRATLREAMRSFEGQGVIRRRQGVGTFVSGPISVIETGLEVLESIETMAEKIGLEVKMGDFERQFFLADEVYAKNLETEPGSELVKISRVIFAEDRPAAYLIDNLPLSIYKACNLDERFTGSVLDRMIESKNLNISVSHTTIHAEAASPSIARALQIQRGDVLLVFKAKLFSMDGRIIDYSESYFLPGYFRFQLMRRVGENKKK